MMKKSSFRIALSVEERKALCTALHNADYDRDPSDIRVKLYERLLSLRDRSKSTAGAYEFRSLECGVCKIQTPHFKKYKSANRWICDECGTVEGTQE
jgi:hypothetical protein